jgi:hypothetical protein
MDSGRRSDVGWAPDPTAVESLSRTHLRTAWGLFKRHCAAFLLIELLILAAWVALEVLVVSARWSPLPGFLYWPLWSLLHVAFFWVFSGLMAGLNSMALQAVVGGSPTLATGLSHLGTARSYLLASLAYWTAVVAGLLLAVIPGLLAAVKWHLFRFTLLSESQSPLASLHTAASLSASRRWHLFRLLSLSTALNLAGAAFLGIGLLITFPTTLILRAQFFVAITKQLAPSPNEK